jgi:hypothetical protein
MKCTYYKTPHYPVFSSFPLILLPYVRKFSSASCSKTASIHVSPVSLASNFHPEINSNGLDKQVLREEDNDFVREDREPVMDR